MIDAERIKKAILNDRPSPEQKAAIFYEKSFILRACPGSGKTWTAARRMAWRLANWNYHVGGIALLSFTNVAVKEFTETVLDSPAASLYKEPHYIGTLDSFVERFIIAVFGHRVMLCSQRPRLFTSPGKHHWSRDNWKITVWRQNKSGKNYPSNEHVWQLFPAIELGRIFFQVKKRRNSSDYIVVPNDACRAQIKSFAKSGFYTHEHRNLWAYLVLKQYPQITNLLAKRFPEIIIDECQDTSGFHQAILGELRLAGANITYIGDSDQCIYEFNQANPLYLKNLSATNGLPELSLTLNRRSNRHIVNASRRFGTANTMQGSFSKENDSHGAFICGYKTNEIGNLPHLFQKAVDELGLNNQNVAIVARNDSTIRKINNCFDLNKLSGATRLFAQAAVSRDATGDYRKSFDLALAGIRALSDDFDEWILQNDRAEEKNLVVMEHLWRFTRSHAGLPDISLANQQWLEQLRSSITQLIETCGASPIPGLGNRLSRRGMPADRNLALLTDSATDTPQMRVATIHQVKGETLDGLMLIANSKFINSALENRADETPPEDVRLAYVAMTRPRHFLLVALPNAHFKNNYKEWESIGFSIYDC